MDRVRCRRLDSDNLLSLSLGDGDLLFLGRRQFLVIVGARAPSAAKVREWLVLDALTSLYAWGILGLLVAGVVPWSSFFVAVVIGSGIALVNQFRTLVAHRWENDDGHQLDAVEQLLDTVNVPPPAMLPMLWAPVGLRYHGLHHLLPGLPYHNLAKAHRRIMAMMPIDGPYRQASAAGAADVLVRLLKHRVQVQVRKESV